MLASGTGMLNRRERLKAERVERLECGGYSNRTGGHPRIAKEIPAVVQAAIRPEQEESLPEDALVIL